MKTSIPIGCLILSLMFLLSGCGFKDIDKRFFVMSIGVDLAKDKPKKYDISLKFASPGVKDQPAETVIVTQNADTISEAVRTIKTKVDKEIDFSHAKVIVLGEKLVKKELPAGIYYWFARRRDIQKIAWVGIGKPSALEVLKIKPKSEYLPSDSLFLLFGKEGSETPYVLTSFYFDFKKRITEKGLDPYLPIIEAKNKELFEVNQAALFDKKKLRLIMTPEETMILNFFLNIEQKSALRVNAKQVVVIDTDHVKIHYKIMTPKGKLPYILVKTDVEGRIEEAVSFAAYNGRLSSYEKAAEKEFSNKIKNFLTSLQKENLDPIGFGLRYRARHFNENDWEEWKRLYPNISFKVQTNVKINDTGLIE